MLEITHLRKSFAGFVAVNDVSLMVESQQIVAVIGPNGAGKSTFFNLITGHLRADTGRVVLDGRDVTGLPPYRICGLGMGRSFQLTNIFPRLTVLQNVQAALIAHRGHGLDFWSRSETLLRGEAEDLLASIGLGAVAGETAGMSAGETHDTIALLRRIALERGLTLLFTEHDMAVVFGIAQKIAVLYQGRKLAEGTPDEMRANPEVRRVYLGEHA